MRTPLQRMSFRVLVLSRRSLCRQLCPLVMSLSTTDRTSRENFYENWLAALDDFRNRPIFEDSVVLVRNWGG